MPILYRTVEKRLREEIGFRCDRCKKEVQPGKDPDSRIKDEIEMQEMFHWSVCGGFGSVWGDGVHAELTLCQKCAFEVLGEFVRYPAQKES